MDPADLRERITDQFSGRGSRADVWRALDRVVDTDSFLNLGYTRRYRPHVLGSSQRRLATRVGERLATYLETTAVPLLDVGCGRGGPAVHLASRYGFDVTGVDLVPYNVTRATETARERGVDARFVVGDATSLPFAPESTTACTAIDSLVYVPERSAAVSEVAAVLAPDGVVACSDLVVGPGTGERDLERVAAFADAWDMAPVATAAEYRRLFVDAGLDLRTVDRLTPHSVGRFRKWTGLFLGLLASPAGPFVGRLLRRDGLDPAAVRTQVRRAHEALPYLEHVLVVASA